MKVVVGEFGARTCYRSRYPFRKAIEGGNVRMCAHDGQVEAK
jgi:hypothetical protein